MRTIKGGKGGIIHLAEKGECTNPNGRPVGTFSISKKLKELIMQEGGWLKFEGAELLDNNDKPTGEKVNVRYKMPNGEAFTIVLMKAAMKSAGDARYLKAMEMILERTDGKVTQPVELTETNKEPQIHVSINSTEINLSK